MARQHDQEVNSQSAPLLDLESIALQHAVFAPKLLQVCPGALHSRSGDELCLLCGDADLIIVTLDPLPLLLPVGLVVFHASLGLLPF